ncbi:hypothetical protein L3D22_18135 [Lysobacter soli]|uniref:hypothetical protein n=1 Tax=Lysobacter soli TaxID=453783 RepID=UPI00209EB757|nr:hypothetical protein [Lysobacter soli]UTA54188.1 hypothetical protein L3D22_18135 [Lysobacter soli]
MRTFHEIASRPDMTRTYRTIRSEPWTTISLLVAIGFVLLAIVGGLMAFSPVPFWDMWDGAIGFYTRALHDPSAWWAQHNEHRIVLARALFWLDITYFRGTSAFLLVVNYLLAAITAAMLARCAWAIPELTQSGRAFLAFLCIALGFSWTQSNNLTWGFQSQFFLAQTLPLAALLVLGKSTGRTRHPSLLFALALILGASAAGSMANGATASLFVAVACVVGRQSSARCVAAIVVAVGVLALYFNGYHSPEGHGSLVASITQHPFDVLLYLLAYLGSPFAFITTDPSRSLWLAIAAGTLTAIAAIYLCSRELLRRERTRVDMRLALVMFLAYLGASAFAISASRSVFGLANAVSSRYTTPVLLILACVILLGVQSLVRAHGQRVERYLPLLLVIPLLLLPQQLRALRHGPFEDFEKMAAALALEMRVADQQQILWTFPNATWALQIVGPAADRDVSIFAHPAIHDAANTIGGRYPSDDVPPCSGGAAPKPETIDGVQGVRKLQGALMAERLPADISSMYILDRDGRIIGRGLLARGREDQSAHLMGAPFKAYVMIPDAPTPWWALSPSSHCRVQIAAE